MQPVMGTPLSTMTNEEFINSIPQLFDVDDNLWRQTQWAAYRVEALKRKLSKEFERVYEACKKELEPERAAGADMRFGFPLECDNKGRVMLTIDNFISILENDPLFADIRYNLMTDTPYNGPRKWQDADDAWLRNEIEKKYHIHSRDKLADAFHVILHRREYHPVRDMIDALEWDGKTRIYTFLTKWLKCDDTDYTREVSRLIFAGGIHRIYNPGCQFDDVAVLIGTKQGEGKSSFVRWLAMKDEYYAEVGEIDGQKGAEAIEGVWIAEFGELLAMARAKEQEAIKSYITRRSDHYRRPYARYATDVPRQNIFIGTTNRRAFVNDATGARRFYPIVVNCNGYELHDKKPEIDEDIRQCWAEAKYLYDQGKLASCANKDLQVEIRAQQSEVIEDDYRAAEIEDYLLHRRIGTLTCVKQLWVEALKMPEDRPISTKDSRDIGIIMQNMKGWERAGNQSIPGFGKPKAWRKIAPMNTD